MDKIKDVSSQEIREADGQWESYLEKIMAAGPGLSVENFRIYRSLETEEEMQAFIAEHQEQ